MRNKLIVLTFLIFSLTNFQIIAQCSKAEAYVAKVKAADNWTPTERVKSGSKVQGWSQLGAWHAYKCECDKGGRTAKEAENLKNGLNKIRQTIVSQYSNAGEIPPIITKCKSGSQTGNSSKRLNNKTSTQIEMENRFRNYNNAMNLKEQGENIAKAYAQQVKSYSELNRTNSPEALLQNFNNNMQAIADLQTQNKADNLNQLTNTLNSSLNDLNSENYEGAMFSALSLLDQGEAKREARREAKRVQQNLIYQTQKKMTAFYMKAVELNDQAIKQYNEKAAYAYSKEEETYLLEYVKNLECHKQAMKTNFSYSNTSWTKNRCPVPEKKTYTINNLIAKDIQYINAAKRKYALYEKTGEPIFQQGAMRFAGLAATEKPKTDYYYLMGHFAGINNPLVAFSSFLTVKSRNTKFFEGDKNAEFSLIKLALESFFKTAIDENNQEVIKNIVGAGLHQSVKIDGNSSIIYAMKSDQADVVFAFLNTELEGKPQSVIKSKVQSALFMSAILDAPKTIQKFVDLGFSIDFTIDGKTPLDVANEAFALSSFDKITELKGGQSKYTLENSDFIKILDIVKSADLIDTNRVVQTYQLLQGNSLKEKAILELLMIKQSEGFFAVFESDKAFVSLWAQKNRPLIFEKFCFAALYRNNSNAYKFLDPRLISLEQGTILNKSDYSVFMKIWIEESRKYKLLPEQEQKGLLEYNFIENPAVKNYWLKSILGEGVWNLNQIYSEFDKEEFYKNWGSEISVYSGVMEDIMEERIFDHVSASKPDIYFYKHHQLIDLIDFSIHYRIDSKMLKILSTHYSASFHNKIQTIKKEKSVEKLSLSHFLVGPRSYSNIKLYPFNEYKDPTSHIKNPVLISNIRKSIIENRLEILKLLILKHEINENAIEDLVKNVIFSETRNIDYNYYKSLIDFLIENGYSSGKFKIKSTFYNKNSLAKWDLEIKNKGDRKYWKAIISGNYDKRY